MRGPWTAGQVIAVAVILAALGFFLLLGLLFDPAPMCPPFCGD